jgi:hypothetical protein
VAVGVQVRHVQPRTFVDAASGAGTLGIAAGTYGIPRIIFNDAWYAAAFWTAFNIQINQQSFDFEHISIHYTIDEMRQHQIETEPRRIAETSGGTQYFEVYQGDYRLLHTVLPEDVDLSVLDLFEKNIPGRMQGEIEEWRKHVSGEVFIP